MAERDWFDCQDSATIPKAERDDYVSKLVEMMKDKPAGEVSYIITGNMVLMGRKNTLGKAAPEGALSSKSLVEVWDCVPRRHCWEA